LQQIPEMPGLIPKTTVLRVAHLGSLCNTGVYSEESGTNLLISY